MDLFLSELARGNVDQHPHDSDALAALVVDGLTPRDHPANGAIGPDHSILAAVVFFLRDGCFYRCFSSWKILRVHALSPCVIAGFDTKWQVTHNQEVFLGPLLYVGAPVPTPAPPPPCPDRKPRPLFTVAKGLLSLPERLLCALTVCDVSYITEKANRVSF